MQTYLLTDALEHTPLDRINRSRGELQPLYCPEGKPWPGSVQQWSLISCRTRIAGPSVNRSRDGGEHVGGAQTSSKWKGWGRALAVRSEEPWQVCVAGTGTALGSTHASLHKCSS